MIKLVFHLLQWHILNTYRPSISNLNLIINITNQHSRSTSLSVFDPFNTEEFDLNCENSRFKQRHSEESNARGSLLPTQDTRRSYSNALSPLSNVMTASAATHIIEKLELKRDKFLNLISYYSSLQDVVKEKSRISFNELKNIRNEMIESINRRIVEENQESLDRKTSF